MMWCKIPNNWYSSMYINDKGHAQTDMPFIVYVDGGTVMPPC